VVDQHACPAKTAIVRRVASSTPPPEGKLSICRHRVPFYETDAMGVVHHSNYVRYLELARIAWMDAHDRPYRDYVAQGLHFATTAVSVRFLRPAMFDDVIEITTWLEWIRRATLKMRYELHRRAELLAVAETEHAMVDGSGRPRRIPAERRASLIAYATSVNGAGDTSGETELDPTAVVQGGARSAASTRELGEDK